MVYLFAYVTVLVFEVLVELTPHALLLGVTLGVTYL